MIKSWENFNSINENLQKESYHIESKRDYNDDIRFILKNQNNEIIGFGMGTENKDGRFKWMKKKNSIYLLDFQINPNYSNKKLGKSFLSKIFLDKLLDILKNKVNIIYVIVLKHNRVAIKIYKNLGFEIDPKYNYYENQILMYKKL